MLEYFVTSDALLCPPSGLYVSYMTFVGGVAQGDSNTKIPTLNSSVRIRPGSRLSLVPCELLRLMNLFEGFGRLSSAASSSFSGGGGGGGAGAFLLLR